MGLDDILKKISSQAESEAHKIVEESKQKARQIKKNAEMEASKQAEEYLLLEKRRAEMEATRIMTQARLDKKMKILFAKKEIISQVLDEAFDQALKGKEDLKKTVVMKDGEKQSTLDKKRIKDELRPEMEGQIAEDLKL
jgi:V/A-type H+/Na+-transporting ATPase subunit E